MTEKLSIREIKEKFPNPTVFDGEGCEGYCVGGALTMFQALKEYPHLAYLPFPGELELSKVLTEVNPDLTVEEAYEYACAITHTNDGGYFEDAWNYLQQALEQPSTYHEGN